MQRNGVLKLFIFYFLVSIPKHAKGQTGCGQTLNVGTTTTVSCPQGYVVYNGLCYLPNQIPTGCCTSNCAQVPNVPPTYAPTSHTSSTYSPPTYPTPPTIKPYFKVSCPIGSLMINEQCRKIICPYGEYIAGRCRKAICPKNTVWRGHSCQERGYITTIIEIDNVFKTKTNESQGNTSKTNENHTNYVVKNSTNSPAEVVEKKPYKPKPLLPMPEFEHEDEPDIVYEPLALLPPRGNKPCCNIYLPRTCKIYKDKWVCFNPLRKACHHEICSTPTVYLKSPEIVEEPSYIIVPPSPPLQECPQQGCDTIATFECSGCSRGIRQSCSPYCYQYNCPSVGCGYIDWYEYCGAYPNQYGCTRAQGCKWNWCSGNRL